MHFLPGMFYPAQHARSLAGQDPSTTEHTRVSQYQSFYEESLRKMEATTVQSCSRKQNYKIVSSRPTLRDK